VLKASHSWRSGNRISKRIPSINDTIYTKKVTVSFWNNVKLSQLQAIVSSITHGTAFESIQNNVCWQRHEKLFQMCVIDRENPIKFLSLSLVESAMNECSRSVIISSASISVSKANTLGCLFYACIVFVCRWRYV